MKGAVSRIVSFAKYALDINFGVPRLNHLNQLIRDFRDNCHLNGPLRGGLEPKPFPIIFHQWSGIEIVPKDSLILVSFELRHVQFISLRLMPGDQFPDDRHQL